MADFVRDVRERDRGIGLSKLWRMYGRMFESQRIGRDKFFEIAARHGLRLRQKRRKPRTTDSRHSFRTYPNIVKDVIPTRPDQIWVADITYIVIHDRNDAGNARFAYLSLLMDSYSKEIVGSSLREDLSTEGPIAALRQALPRLSGGGGESLIHHSDRGSQYASQQYTDMLKDNGIGISMTECGNPKDNAQAERLNSTIKNELFRGMRFHSMEEARDAIGNAIEFYNNVRPHASLDMMTPREASFLRGDIRKHWTSYRENFLRSM